MSFSLRAPELAGRLEAVVDDLPIVSPHGHLPVEQLREASLGDPASLFVTGDHYVLRMLYSLGVPLEQLGVGRTDLVEDERRAVWRRFSEYFDAFRGTPSRWWILDTLSRLFGIEERPSAANSDRLFDELTIALAAAPATLLDRQRVAVLCTTDDAGADLARHAGLPGAARILPTFRPDLLGALHLPAWRTELEAVERESGVTVVDLRSFRDALRERRRQFAAAGAVATDHGLATTTVFHLTDDDLEGMLADAFAGRATAQQAAVFSAHLPWEMARLSLDDGLVLQLRAGIHRDHDVPLARRFGPAIGGDVPLAANWTAGLHEFLVEFGSAPGLRIVLSTLDESTYSRELAPLAGHYPAVRLGPPWWFHDTANGIRRYLDSVVEVAGFRNLAGFTDDARNLATLGSRHRLWRRSVCGWLADQVAAGLLEEDESREVAIDLALNQTLDTYRIALSEIEAV